jgi:glucose/arabinose dehydrogenase
VKRLAVLVLAGALAACGSSSGSGSSDAGATPTAGANTPDAGPARGIATRDVATGLHVPWGIAFLPNGDAIVAERTTGRILRIPKSGGKPRLAMSVPGVDTNAGEGGLLGLAVSPDYASDKLIYAYFTSTRGDNRIVRGKLGGTLRPILTGLHSGAIHNGGRIAFGPDGKLYAGVGETGNTAYAQNRKSLNGKILRMNPDGSVPPGNPFPGSLVWTLGHRNVQGLAWDRSGRMWASEFGQDTFDEVNLIRKGHNYGWPIVEGKGSTHGGKFTNPLLTWRTSQASPSGAAVKGSYLYVGALAGQRVWRMKISGTRLGAPRKLLDGRYGRIRTVVLAPDGSLWLSTSNRDGRGSPRKGDDRIVSVTGG